MARLPGMVGAGDGGDADRRAGRGRDQALDRHVQGRKGEAVTAVDAPGGAADGRGARHGVAVDLAAGRLRGVGGEPGEAVPRLAVHLGREQRVGDRAGVVRVGGVRGQRLDRQLPGLVEAQRDIGHQRASSIGGASEPRMTSWVSSRLPGQSVTPSRIASRALAAALPIRRCGT